jgi:hypothetical protein
VKKAQETARRNSHAFFPPKFAEDRVHQGIQYALDAATRQLEYATQARYAAMRKVWALREELGVEGDRA